MFSAIVAVDKFLGIGKDGSIPWHIKEDMKMFKQITSDNVVIMGRKTYQSIGWPLPNRINIIISKTIPQELSDARNPHPDNKDTQNKQPTLIFSDPMECVKYCYAHFIPHKKCFVIGGSQIYAWFYEHGFIREEFITLLSYSNYECDTIFLCNTYYMHGDMQILKTFNGANRLDYSDPLYVKSNMALNNHINPYAEVQHTPYINQYEIAMLKVMRDILHTGSKQLDRTQVGTLSVFGKMLEFPLHHNTFPLMTTKKLPLRWIFEELMLYIRGQTDSKILERKGIDIWKPNTSKEFLAKSGVGYLPEGDMGESYGFLFRHFGAEYIDCNTDYTNKGVDQLAYVINELKTNKASRRAIISLWKPMSKTALPPCLEQYIFNVDNDNQLSCMMVQRSSDFFTAGGWNVATGSLLTILIAQACDLKPHRLVWCIANVHIYNNLIEQACEQIERVPYLYPKLFLKKVHANIEDYQYEDLELIGYISHPTIKGVMNA